MEIIKKLLLLFLILVASYHTVSSLLTPGYFPMHDDTQPARIFEMNKAISDGNFPVRWVSDLGYGYGYPLFNFYAPLSYYVGAAIMFTGADVIVATKIAMILGILLASVSMYLLGKELFGIYGGIIASIAYTYAPYHAVDIYVRGDMAEFWAYGFIPLLFYGAWKIFNSAKYRYVIIGALSYAGLILSHNLTAFMVSGFLAIFIIVFGISAYKKGRVDVLRYFGLMMGFGILIACFYWIPTFLEMGYTNVLSQVGGGADFKDHFVCPAQLWNSAWGFGGSVAGCLDGMSFKVGKIHLILSFISIFLSIFMVLRKVVDAGYVLNPRGMFFIFSALGFIIAIFLTVSFSKPVWDTFYVFSFFQYPWRFLLMVSFFSSLLSGFFVWLISKSISIEFHSRYFLSAIMTMVIGALLIIVNYKLFIPQTINEKTASIYTSDIALKWDMSKISDEYMPRHFNKPGNKNDIVKKRIISNEKVDIVNISDKTGYAAAQLRAKKDSDIHINIAYFPAWNLYIDGEKKNYTIVGNGLVLKIPKGDHLIEAKFVSTTVEIVTNLISIISFSVLFLGIISSVRKKCL